MSFFVAFLKMVKISGIEPLLFVCLKALSRAHRLHTPVTGLGRCASVRGSFVTQYRSIMIGLEKSSSISGYPEFFLRSFNGILFQQVG